MNPVLHYDPDDPYPESDGEPMAENSIQYDWLVRIKDNLEVLFADDPQVFVAGNLFWYPVPDRQVSGPLAPDVMVAFGRPKGPRPCYKQWEEGGIAPQVVFEILSPANSALEMRNKRGFYDRYGVEEYYVYDPQTNRLEVWLRQGGRLKRMSHLNAWTSPRLGIRFALGGGGMTIYDPRGEPFLNAVERAARQRADQARAAEADRRAEREAAEAAAARAEAAAERTEAEAQRARAEREAAAAAAAEARAEQLAARLRALGIEP